MELSAELSFGVGPVHRLLGAGFHAGLRLLQLLFVPAGRFVALAPAHNGIPELLERAELLLSEAHSPLAATIFSITLAL